MVNLLWRREIYLVFSSVMFLFSPVRLHVITVQKNFLKRKEISMANMVTEIRNRRTWEIVKACANASDGDFTPRDFVVQDFPKANETHKIEIGFRGCSSANIDITAIYKADELPGEDVFRKLVESLRNITVPESLKLDKETLLSHVRACALNKEKNQAYLNCPHVFVQDLMVIFRSFPEEIQSGQDESFSSIIMTDQICAAYGITLDELVSEAKKQEYLVGLFSPFNPMMPVKFYETPPKGEPMYVLGTRNGMYGAGAILFKEKLREYADILEEKKLYILPSSIHELLLVPASSGMQPMDLSEMVGCINASDVIQSDIFLSNSVYIYDVDKDESILYDAEAEKMAEVIHAHSLHIASILGVDPSEL